MDQKIALNTTSKLYFLLLTGIKTARKWRDWSHCGQCVIGTHVAEDLGSVGMEKDVDNVSIVFYISPEDVFIDYDYVAIQEW